MKTPFLLILSLSFTLTTLGQQLTKQQVYSLLNGTWKADSSKAILKFDCHRKDTIITYGVLSQKNMDWYASFKLTTVNLSKTKCTIPDSGVYYMVRINYTSDPRMIPQGIYEYKIVKITDKKLDLFAIYNYRPQCKLITYSKVK